MPFRTRAATGLTPTRGEPASWPYRGSGGGFCVARLYRDGRLSLPVTWAFPLEAAPDAHHEIETGHVRGKLVLLTND